MPRVRARARMEQLDPDMEMASQDCEGCVMTAS